MSPRAGVAQTFRDWEQDVRQSIELIRSSPFIGLKGSIPGFIYDVTSGEVREVT